MLNPVKCHVTYEYGNSSRAITKKTMQSNTLKNTVSKSRNKPVVEIGQFSILVLWRVPLEWGPAELGRKLEVNAIAKAHRIFIRKELYRLSGLIQLLLLCICVCVWGGRQKFLCLIICKQLAQWRVSRVMRDTALTAVGGLPLFAHFSHCNPGSVSGRGGGSIKYKFLNLTHDEGSTYSS